MFEALADNGLDFYTLKPCRVIDTRLTGSPLSPQAIQVVSFPGQCGVPATATAVVVNVTVVGPTGPGYLNAWRSDISEPLTSVISFKAGANRANNAVLSLSRDGQGSVFVKPFFAADDGTAHLVIDVNGYLE